MIKSAESATIRLDCISATIYETRIYIQRIGEQKKDQFTRDREGGFDTIEYDLTRTDELQIGSTKVTILNVELKCNIEKTPWCKD